MSDRYRPPSSRPRGRPDHGAHRYRDRDRYDPPDRHVPRDRDRFQDHFDSSRNHQLSEHRDRYEPSRPRNANGNDMYHFRGAANRQEQQFNGDFTFRAGPPTGPRFPSPVGGRFQPSFDGIAGSHVSNSYSGRHGHPSAKRTGRDQLGERGRRGRRGFVPRAAHGRDILKNTERESTPEQLEGMNLNGNARFVDISSSDEGSESGQVAESTSNDSGDDEQVSRKRQKTMPVADTLVVSSAPKWSNPDTDTALPPPDASGGPKKDIVQFIRKSRAEAAANVNGANAVSENIDFISFNTDDQDAPSPEELEFNAASSTSAYSPRSDPHDMRELYDEDGYYNKRITIPLAGNGASQGNRLPPGPGLFQGSDSKNERPPGESGRRLDPAISPEELLQRELAAKSIKDGAMNSKRKRGVGSASLGEVVDEWAPRGNPTPWYQESPSETTDRGLLLHREICDFYDFVRPQPHETEIREDLIDRVEHEVRGFSPETRGYLDVRIQSFGSFAAGVFLPLADMDLVFLSRQFRNSGRPEFCKNQKSLYRLAQFLRGRLIAESNSLTVIAKARVPIIKFVEARTRIKVDISFENNTGMPAVRTFKHWQEKFPAMPIIVSVIKQFLAMRNLNEVHTGGIGGFTTICLVVSMLQHMPEVQSGSVGANQNYGLLLLHFFDLYGNKFNVEQTGICMEPPEYFDKVNDPHPCQSKEAGRLTIIDPNNPANDIAGGSRNIGVVFEAFRKAHADLQRRMMHSTRSGSLLHDMLGGDYSSVIDQRTHLLALANSLGIATAGFNPPRGPKAAERSQRPRSPRGHNTLKHSRSDSQDSYEPPPASFTAINTPVASNRPGTAGLQATDIQSARQQPIRASKFPQPTAPSGMHSLPPKPPSKKKKANPALSSEDVAARESRAESFKRDHPNVRNVPNQLTRQEFKVLKLKHK